jgi:hypothetical protein
MKPDRFSKVVQEFVLARSVAIWCGELVADAADFDEIWNKDKPLLGFQKLSAAITRTSAWPLFRHRRDFRRTHTRESVRNSFRLRELLRSFESSQSSEVFDKVYGFLGIASDTHLVTQPIRPDYSKAPVDLLVDVLRSQYRDPSIPISLDDYEFVSSLMQTLRITRMDFAKHLLRQTPKLNEHIYMFAVLEFLVVSITPACTITNVGTFEHISGSSDNDTRTAIMTSCTRLPQLTPAEISELTSPAMLRDIALGLDFEVLARNQPLFRNMILGSMRAIMQKLFDRKRSGPSSGQDRAIRPRPEQEANNIDLPQKFTNSFNNAVHAARYNAHYSPNWFRKYAVFKGTNDQIGVLCAEDDYESAAKADVYLVTGSDKSRKALLVQKHGSTQLLIVGFAIIMSSVPSPYLSNIVQPLPSIYRKGEPTRKSSYPPALVRSDTATCFHCHIIELLELGRCGIVDGLQLNQILERSLRGSADDEVHRCGIGTNQCPSLEFETNTRVAG